MGVMYIGQQCQDLMVSIYVTVRSNFVLRMCFICIKLLPKFPSVLLLNWAYRNQRQVLEFNKCLFT